MPGKLLLAVSSLTPVEPAGLTVHTGQIDGAEYRVEVPFRWNGTLSLYSHGTCPAGYTPPIEMASRPAARTELLDRGYALAASRYRVPRGHSVPDALRDQPALVSWFSRSVGRPKRVIAWGSSLGGLTSVMPGERGRFDGVPAMCGALGGAVQRSGRLLDPGFVVRTPLSPPPTRRRVPGPVAPGCVGERRSGYPGLVAGARTPPGGGGGDGDPGSRSRPNARALAGVGQRPRRHRDAGRRRSHRRRPHRCRARGRLPRT
ncbi:hypothetical protein ACSHWB_46595 [Lentzea sp. HUAS TT2]|uniref:hypothetical protein n=1 Tax=Lentzea sp. HUAS TT2 TaxID=3447454 RepID=UPI003F6F7E91